MSEAEDAQLPGDTSGFGLSSSFRSPAARSATDGASGGYGVRSAKAPDSTAAFLEDVGLGHYKSRVEDAEVDLSLLPSLQQSELKELGMTVGARRRLRNALASPRYHQDH